MTEKPWKRIPLQTKTFVFNPTLACLAGGRNKMVASKAYSLFNTEIEASGLVIRTPETICDVSHDEIPLWVGKLGGFAVIKIPYSNAGQGVFTITNAAELDAFMRRDQPYDQYIVQSLIGNYQWSSRSRDERLYHIGTVPTKRQESYVADLRMMVSSSDEGYAPMALYARRARKPLVDRLDNGAPSWDVLGTNLSVKLGNEQWTSETQRLLLMDQRDFNQLGLGVDDLIDAFVQTILAAISIDKLSTTLMSQKGKFKLKLFGFLDNDEKLLNEIRLS